MPKTLTPGAAIPKLTVQTVEGHKVMLGSPDPAKGNWQLVIVYRGKHCPICKSYLIELNGMLSDFNAIDVDVLAVSADPLVKAKAEVDDIGYDGVVGIDLSVEQMNALGLFVSDPRSPQETDRPFSEPAAFVVRGDGSLQIIDISNAPFARPALKGLLDGLTFIRKNDYPVRGTHGIAS
jgi:peroxiredoxin